jgi:hypothetical protein
VKTGFNTSFVIAIKIFDDIRGMGVGAGLTVLALFRAAAPVKIVPTLGADGHLV